MAFVGPSYRRLGVGPKAVFAEEYVAVAELETTNGFMQLYWVYHKKTQNEYVLKILDPRHASDNAMWAKFDREAPITNGTGRVEAKGRSNDLGTNLPWMICEFDGLPRDHLIESRYQIIERIAVGGQSYVYKVLHIPTGRIRALKHPHPRFAHVPQMRERLRLEVLIPELIRSDHVVDVTDVGSDSGVGYPLPWVAMEYLEGMTLEAHLEKIPILSPTKTRQILDQISHPLGIAHHLPQPIVHRDLNPRNIFLARSRHCGVVITAKLLDFGVARMLAPTTGCSTGESPPRYSRPSTFVGVPLWMPPEQLQQGEVHPASDVWCFGLLAFLMLSGKDYWNAEVFYGRMEHGEHPVQIFRDMPFAPASVRARELGSTVTLPPGFDAWFARCVHPDTRSRFPDVEVAMNELRPVLSPELDVRSNAPRAKGDPQ